MGPETVLDIGAKQFWLRYLGTYAGRCARGGFVYWGYSGGHLDTGNDAELHT